MQRMVVGSRAGLLAGTVAGAARIAVAGVSVALVGCLVAAICPGAKRNGVSGGGRSELVAGQGEVRSFEQEGVEGYEECAEDTGHYGFPGYEEMRMDGCNQEVKPGC